MAKAGLRPEVEFVETSAVLRAAQAERVPRARWHDHVTTLPENLPLIVVANEFFDALPVRQIVAGRDGWRERRVDHRDGRFVPVAGPLVPEGLVPASLGGAEGAIFETSPASLAVVRALAQRIEAQGGAALIVDYGHCRSALGDTLQAVARHGFADPWTSPGEADLTAHVDFEALARAAGAEGVRASKCVEQGAFLKELGIDARAAALSRAAPERAAEIEAARSRLVDARAMGALFKAMAFTARAWPVPAGFS
jgi:SAM-dependent MidA family methyltransferase